MSYCHLTSDGINMNHGFGPYPAELMRNKVANASCLTTCEKATDTDNCKNVCADTDGDGKGNPNDCQEVCADDHAGWVENGDDCDDNNADKYTGAECRDSDDCAGVLLANCDCDSWEAPRTYYADNDGDGWGNASDSVEACTAPAGYADKTGDCDDNAATVFPEAPCVKDNLCDGFMSAACDCTAMTG